jgi:hypothetical protein
MPDEGLCGKCRGTARIRRYHQDTDKPIPRRGWSILIPADIPAGELEIDAMGDEGEFLGLTKAEAKGVGRALGFNVEEEKLHGSRR